MSAEHCKKCGRARSDYITTAWCTVGVYCDYVPDDAPTVEQPAAPLEQRFDALEQRVKALLNNSRERLYEHGTRLDRLERPVDSRDAIAWEMGHAAASRGDAVHTNPFRKPAKRGAL